MSRSEDTKPTGGIIPPAALCLMSIFAATLPLFSGHTIVDSPHVADIGYQWIPFSAFVKDCYSQAIFPLWDHHNFCGMPFLAFSHTGSLYLPTLVFNLLSESYSSLATLDIAFHLSVGSIGTYIMLTTLGRSRAASFACGVAFAFSGFFFNNIHFQPSLHTAAWLPLWWGTLFLVYNRATIFHFFLASIAFSLVLLGGDVEIAFYGILGFLFETALRLWEKSISLKEVIAPVAAILLGGFIAFAQMLPVAELAVLSVRAGESVSVGTNPVLMALLPVVAVFQVPVPAPGFPPNNGLDPFYLGIIIVVFLVFGSVRLSYSRKRLLAVPAAAFLLILLYVPPFNEVGRHIPIMNGFMIPHRVLPTLHLFILLAAAAGMDRWIEGPENGDNKEAEKYLFFGRAASIFLVIFGLITAASLFYIEHGIYGRAFFCAVIIGVGTYTSLRPDFFSKRGRKSGFIVVFVLLDIYLLALCWLPRTDPELLEVDRKLVEHLGHTSGQARYMVFASKGIVDSGLPYNLGLRIDADTIDSFVRVPPKSMARRLDLLYPELVSKKSDGSIKYDQMSVHDPENLDPEKLDMINMMNVRFLVSRFPIKKNMPGLDLKPLLESVEYHIYVNRSAYPRAFSGPESKRGKIQARYQDSGRIRLNGEVGENNIFLSESYYPGWRAFSGGKELGIENTEFSFMMIPSPKGGEIDLVYRPFSFKTGLWAGLTTIAFVLFMAVLRITALKTGN